MSALSSSASRFRSWQRSAGSGFPAGDNRPRRVLVVGFSVAFGAAIFVLRISIGGLQDATLLLYTIPVALIAIEMGFWPGVLAAISSIGFFALYVAIKDVHPSLVGWLSRASAWLVAGAVVGAGSDRLRANLRAQEELNLTLEQMNADLREFTYILSHDLSEPLRSIAGFAQFLDEEYGERLDDEGRRYVTHVIDGAERMRSLIADVLDFSRAAREVLEPEEVELGALVEHTVADMSAAIQGRGAVVVKHELPRVRADPMQLGVVIQNLISNALKFTRATPRIEISASRDARGWRIAVTDNGIGVEPRHAERVFGLFQRLHTRDAYPGTGLGLAISKRVIERHGGRIGVEPAPGGGSTFYFTIPDQVERIRE